MSRFAASHNAYSQQNDKKQPLVQLFGKQGIPVCDYLEQISEPYPEIQVINLLSQPLPHHLRQYIKSIPAVFLVEDGTLFFGSQAIEFIKKYIERQSAQSGAQSQMVVKTTPGNVVAPDLEQLHNETNGPHGIPLGASTSVNAGAFESLSSGDTFNNGNANFDNDNGDWRYTADKIDDNAIQLYQARLKVHRPPRNQKQIPSALEDGSYVTM